MGRIFGLGILICGGILVIGWLGFFTNYAQGWFLLTAAGFLGAFAFAAAFTWWTLWQFLRQPASGDKALYVALILVLGPVGALLGYLHLRQLDSSSRL